MVNEKIVLFFFGLAPTKLTNLNKNFRQYSRGNADSKYLKISCKYVHFLNILLPLLATQDVSKLLVAAVEFTLTKNVSQWL